MHYHTRSMAHIVPKEAIARALPPRRVHPQDPVKRAKRRPLVLTVPSLLSVLSDYDGIVGDTIRGARKKSGPMVFLTPQAESRWAQNALLKEWAFNQREINRGWMQDNPETARAMQAQLLQTVEALKEMYG